MKHLIVVAIALLTPVLAFADPGFTFDVPETELTVPLDSTAAFHNMLTNTGDAQDILILTMYDEVVPGDWLTFFCINDVCLAPFVTTFPDTMEAGEQDEIIVEILVRSEGTGTLWFSVQSTNNPDLIESVQFTVNGSTGLPEPDVSHALPVRATISDLYPNPFNSSSRFSFELAVPTRVSIALFTIEGRKIATVADGFYAAGVHSATLNSLPAMSSGVYLVHLNAGSQSATVRAVYLK